MRDTRLKAAVSRPSCGMAGRPPSLQPKRSIEGALAGARDGGIVEPVVRERIQHAVREEAVPQLDAPVEQHLDAVPDPDVAQGLAQLLQGQARIEGLRLPRERDGGLEEGVPEQQPAVAVGPAEPLLAEGLQARAQLLAPGEARRLVLGDALESGGELVDQAGRRPGIRELAQEPDACADLGQLGRRRRPERELLVTPGCGSRRRVMRLDQRSQGGGHHPRLRAEARGGSDTSAWRPCAAGDVCRNARNSGRIQFVDHFQPSG